MMYKNKGRFFLLILMVLSNHLNAQFELNYFIASQQNDKVKLSWEVAAGSTCNGMQIERSFDSINYSFIGEVEGICGSGTSAQKFDFTDENPASFKKNYYRLVAGSGERFYQNILFSYVEDSFFFIQNPVSPSSIIYFEGNQTFIVNFYTISGQIIHSSSVSDPYISLQEILGEVPKGLFLLDVQAENGSHETKKLIGTH